MWKKRDDSKILEDIIRRNTGQSIGCVLHPRHDSRIANLEQAAALIREATRRKTPITIAGDYDADGITGSAILCLTLKALGTNADVRLPKRFTEGYGISMTMLDGITEGLLITVDNGITAVEEIAAKAKGLQVVILDHHIAREDGLLPEADVLVNPHVLPNGEFSDYCGAGLAYKLACLLLEDESLLEQLCALAAIGTVADVVPLKDDNRSIVQNGLHAINQGNCPQGLNELLNQLNLFDVDEGDISFTIAPILNAAGRMHDDGAIRSFKLLTESGSVSKLAEELIRINEERKAAQQNGLQVVEDMIAENCLYGDRALLVYSNGRETTPIPEGIAGILAGRLSERYQVPAFVLTSSGTKGILKGSGRSYGNIDIKALLDSAASLLEAYGGHPKAAGLSVREENAESLRSFLNERLAELPVTTDNTDTLFYDMEVKAAQLPSLIEQLAAFAPFGEGNERPVILIRNQQLYPRQRRFFTYMGRDDQHIKLYCGNKLAAVGFDLAEKYTEHGEPISLDLIGTIFTNKYMDPMGRRLKETQLRIDDLRKPTVVAFSSPLTASVQARLEALGGVV